MPTNDPAARIREIEGRLNKATPGPWTAEIEGDADNGYAHMRQEGRGWVAFGYTPEGKPDIADAEFCAHSRTDIPWLIAQVRVLQQRIAELEAALEFYGNNDHYATRMPPSSISIFKDHGARARAALDDKRGEGKDET